MSAADDLIRNNERYAAGFDKGDLPAPPAKRLAVLACMDARVDVHKILGLEEGDAHVLRNAGGVVTDDEIRSLAISQHLLGTEEIVLVHHTDCGMLKFTDDEFAGKLEELTGEWPPWSPHSIDDLEESVRESARRIADSPFIPHTEDVRCFIYEVETGRLREVT
jgi:carbonic anhydrase